MATELEKKPIVEQQVTKDVCINDAEFASHLITAVRSILAGMILYSAYQIAQQAKFEMYGLSQARFVFCLFMVYILELAILFETTQKILRRATAPWPLWLVPIISPLIVVLLSGIAFYDVFIYQTITQAITSCLCTLT